MTNSPAYRHSLYFGVEQFPNRTSNNLFLTSVFLSSMGTSIFFKVSQNRTKLQQNKTNKQTNDPDHLFAKNKLSISEPNFTKSEGKVRFGQIFF